jgi:hypothetical protein
MTPAQCRAARHLLDLPREELAAAVDISSLKLVAFEIGMLVLKDPERARLQNALELAGVELVDSDRPGVRLRKGTDK